MSKATSTSTPLSSSESTCSVQIPRIAIRFCTQCKWNLRAAYYAQELLQTFSTSLGEVSLIPEAGGIFEITLHHTAPLPIPVPVPQPHTPTSTESSTQVSSLSGSGVVTPTTSAYGESVDEMSELLVTTTVIWERKRDGGFPETKELKNRVRNIIDPMRDMGHIDRSLKKTKEPLDGDDERKQKEAAPAPVTKSDVPGGTSGQPQASGGESLQFAKNVENQVAVAGNTEQSQGHDGHGTDMSGSLDKQECEDCK